MTYIRAGVYDLSEVLPHVNKARKDAPDAQKEFDGHPVWMNHVRYRVFASKGVRCAFCGLKGTFFALERHATQMECERFHLNLYGVDENGEEVLFTRDHIIPRSMGGTDALENQQTLCKKCNERKGSSTIVWSVG